VLFDPTETKLTGTLVARPTVYWIPALAAKPASLLPWGSSPPSRVWRLKVLFTPGRNWLKKLCVTRQHKIYFTKYEEAHGEVSSLGKRSGENGDSELTRILSSRFGWNTI
jgi:hypothetical protein